VARPTRATTHALASLTAAALAAAPLALVAPAQANPAGTDLVVSEVYGGGGNTGAPYNRDFVEVHNPTGATVTLTGYSVEYFSAGGGSGGRVSLAGQLPAGGTYLVGLASGATGAALPAPDVTGSTNMSATNGRVDLAKNGTLVDRVGYGTANPFEGDAAAPTGSNTTSLQRTPAPGTDSDRNNVDLRAAAPAPTACGAACEAEEPEPDPTGDCGDPTTAIHDIQGTGATFDPAFGGTRTIEGIVTSAMLGGFWIQEEAADEDDDPQTSEGLFVFRSGAAAPPEGHVVRVTGNVAEFGGKTQLSGVTSVLDCGEAAEEVEPVDVTFPLADTNLEHLEGMRVTLPETLVISEYFNYDRFGEFVLAKPRDGETRLYTPTAVVDPGPQAQELLAENERRQILVDDRSTQQNPSVLPHPGNGEPFSLDNRFRGGDTVTGISGVLDEAFDAYRLQPTSYGEYEAVNERPESRPEVGGDVQVASFNVLNYFLTLDAGDNQCGPNVDQDCRGANNANELQRQRAKIVAAIAGLDADVVGLMEMENSPGVEPAADLVDGLNDELGEGTYDYIDTGVIGGDAIRLGFLYKPGSVTPAGDFDVLDSSDDPRFDETKNRPMLTQTFDTVPADGEPAERFTVSVNHLKSKGSDCEDVGDPDTGDGQGNCNLTRTAAAEAIADHLASDPTDSGDPDHLVIGDLNSYDHEDPIRALEAAGYEDQVKRFGGEKAYGYVFDGMVGYLDHGLASSSLAGQVTGAAEWHINADEPDVLDYDTSFKPSSIDAIYAPDRFRSSDHDPVLIGLDLVDTELSATVTPKKPKTGKAATVVVDVTRADGAEATDGTVTVLRDGEVVGTAEVTGNPVRVSIEPFTSRGRQELEVRYSGGTSEEASTTVTVDVVGKP
jgi:predicted extracellular nuclease